MISEIAGALSVISSATKTVASILKTERDVEIKKAISGILDSLLDAQAKLLAAHSQYEAQAEVKRDLEQKIVEYEKWDSESTRYGLKELAAGILVYELKPDQTRGEPIHWLCPYCFQQRQKSILSRPGVDYLNYKCHRCSFETIPQSQHFSQSSGGDFDI